MYRLSMDTLKVTFVYWQRYVIWFFISSDLFVQYQSSSENIFLWNIKGNIIHPKNITLVSSDLHFPSMIIMISTVLYKKLSAGNLHQICHYCVGYSLNIESNKSKRFNICSIYYDATTVQNMKVIIYQL